MQGLVRSSATVRKRAMVWLACVGLSVLLSPALARAQWAGYGRNAQHTALAAGPSQLPLAIRWQTPIDLNPQFSGGELLIHYGSPAITAANNILVPVKTGAAGGFIVKAITASTGVPL